MTTGKKPNRKAAEQGKPRQDGWLKIHRKLLHHPRYQDSQYIHIWVHLLLSAAFAEKTAIFEGKSIQLKPGQLISSRRAIASATGVDPAKALRVIEWLKSDQQIDHVAGSQASLFTVLKWAKYQTADPRDDPRPIHDRSTTDPRPIHEPHKTQAGVRENGPKKERRKEGKKTVQSLQADRGGIGGTRGGAANAGAPVEALVLPTFAPVSTTLFPDEYRQLIEEARRQIEALKVNPANVTRTDDLKPKVAEDIGWLEAKAETEPEKAEAALAEAARLRADPRSYQSVGWRPDVKLAIAAWRDRIRALEAALSGRIAQ